jgi:hypothetical protein
VPPTNFISSPQSHQNHIAGSIIVRQIGHAILTVNDTTYLITLPKLRIDGLWYGSPYIELTDTSHIVGGGFVSTIEYKGKGYFSGKSHTFKAVVTPQNGTAAKEHIIEGLWHEKSKFTKGPQIHQAFYDVITSFKEICTVAGGEPDGSQGQWETRKLWNLVAKGIREGDYDTASKEKSRIENEQRQMRRDEKDDGRTWELKHFRRKESDPECESLARVRGIFDSRG